ncbi:hatching enzyme-like [Mytilus galloprovincialis]|uniref:hatching enzyme-like n=1 Tax=Mytilus galloprovincialis TaxID=29158 RepID=UPI003F7C1925
MKEYQCTKWSKKSLTYRITGETDDLSSAPIRSEIARAFKFWTDVADIEITETSCSTSDIVISFETWDHNDGNPFDGEGGVLAHAFYPPGGMCHFDDSETWVINRAGYDLFIIGAHEVGHLLGLRHTDDTSALMYPYYPGYTAGYTIQAYDRAAIIAHYGSGTGTTSKQLPCSASLVIRGNISILLSMVPILYYFDIFIIS